MEIGIGIGVETIENAGVGVDGKAKRCPNLR